MKNLIFTLTTMILGFHFMANGEEAVCKKCQLVREFNEKHPSKYEYYEEYLKDKEAGVAEDIQFKDENFSF